MMAISNIDARLPQYESPTRSTFSRDKSNGTTERKTFRRYKQDKIVEFIKETEQDAKTLAKILIYEQFETISKNFQLALDGLEMAPYIDSLDERMFGNEIKIIDVPHVNRPGDGSTVEWNDLEMAIERYVYLDPKSDVNFPVSLPFDSGQTKGVVSLPDWEQWIKDVNEADPEFCEKSLSAYFGNLQALTDAETGEVVGTEGSIGVKYGLRQIWGTKSATLGSRLLDGGDPNVARELRAFSAYGLCAIPLASTEAEVLDVALNSFDVENSYDIGCLKDQLFNEADWLLLWKYCIPLPKYLSLLAIYVVKGFLPSIGQSLGENDGAEGPIDFFKDLFANDQGETPDFEGYDESGINGGEWDKEASTSRGFTYYDWDQDTFRKTKRSARRMFTSFWNYRDAPSFDLDLEFKLDMKRDLRELMDFNLSGVKLSWPLRIRLADRPFDKDDEECD
jgi:hypothetical protein